MIPENGEANEIVIRKEPSKTYKLDIENGIIRGKCDNLDAVKQAVYKAINTGRYDWLIYSWNYGSEIKELFGKPVSHVYDEVKRRISECLLHDDRVERVEDFTFEKNKGSLHVKFTVVSSEGSFESEVDVIV